MHTVRGLHHITAIAGPAQENLDFYAGILGMRLVKRSINQDDPGTYHLFYADAEGHPGTDLTFFPWAQMAPPRLGHGLAVEVGLEVPAGSLAWWGRASRSTASVRVPSKAALATRCCRWWTCTACGWR
jgi:glyoxalase family protein